MRLFDPEMAEQSVKTILDPQCRLLRHVGLPDGKFLGLSMRQSEPPKSSVGSRIVSFLVIPSQAKIRL